MSMFYFAGRMRRQQLRRLSRIGRFHKRIELKKFPDKAPGFTINESDYNGYFEYKNKKKYHSTASLIEHRIDSVLVRSRLCSTLMQSRELVKHGKVLVNGQKITYCAYICPNFAAITLSLAYRIRRKKELNRLAKNNRFGFYIPTNFMYVDFRLLLVWLWRNPGNVEKAALPFPEGSLSTFIGSMATP
jgi:ribosomal protein S4